MTYFKLSMRNAGRQARDYLVYFVTMVLAAALLFAFNALAVSGEVLALTEISESFSLMIVLASLAVVCVFGWLAAYSTRFMLSRRSRELGIYLLSGLTGRQVARLFFLENLAVGAVALVLGTGLGGLLYQVMRAIVMAMFAQPYRFALEFSLAALGRTALYFALIYLFALGRSRRHIRRMKIYDLIYFERQNEGVILQKGKTRRLVFGVSLALGAVGTCLLMRKSLYIALAGAFCAILALFGFFLSFASGVPAFFERRPARKYRGQTLLIFRGLTAKLASMGVLMAVLSIVFTATLISEGSSSVLYGIMKGRTAEAACFDLYIGIEGGQPDPEPYLTYIRENIPVERELLYSVCLTGKTQVQDYLEGAYYNNGYDSDPVLCWSDYAALRALAGYPAVEPPGSGQFLIHCMSYLAGPLGKYQEALLVGETALSPGGIYTEHLSQSYGTANGRGYILVVPDRAAEGLPVHHIAYAAKTARPVTTAQYEALADLARAERDRQEDPSGYVFVLSKAYEETEVAAQAVVGCFPLYYLALALMMTAVTILTIQQLSETEHYRSQFALLRKLGMDRREMARALGSQFALYYTLPAVPAVLIAGSFIVHLAMMPEPGVMVGLNSPAVIVMISLGAFFLIYAIYILLAYTSLKRNVLPK